MPRITVPIPADLRAEAERTGLSTADRFAVLSARAATEKESAVWRERELPRGWSIDEFCVGLDAFQRELFVWRVVHDRTGAVDHMGTTKKWKAVRRAWELAVQADSAPRGAA